MPKFEVIVDWSGYSRGVSSYIIEAKNEEDARERWWENVPIHREIIRDDTDKEINSVTEV